ncbi:MAG: UDP-glucose 4-epimerase GalE [Bdellovibrionales bacterium]|nr:UDP-glucose 4-epimerase GalE [Bdellovibrionales bacterium]
MYTKSVLITGSSGYIGSHFTKYFTQKGYHVFGLDVVEPKKELRHYLKDFLHTDIADTPLVLDYLARHKPMGVIHCAAKALVAESVAFPQMYEDYNVTRANAFLETCISSSIANFIFSSTAAVYGEPLHIPIKEDHPRSPVNPYGETKKKFEDILLKKHHDKEINAGIFRYFNACGADFDAELGECHEPETHLIPNVIKSILEEKPLHIFGNQFSTRDGTCVRDYIHVIDLAHSHYLLMEQMIQSQMTDNIFNLGTEGGYSILEIIDAAQKILTKKVHFEIKNPRPGDPATLIASHQKAKTVLGWEPQWSDLETILTTAWAWHQKQ